MTSEFWLNRDHWKPVAKVASPKEMAAALATAPPEVVTHHMGPGKNDFAEWAEKSLKNIRLVRRLRKISPIPPSAALRELALVFEQFSKT